MNIYKVRLLDEFVSFRKINDAYRFALGDEVPNEEKYAMVLENEY